MHAARVDGTGIVLDPGGGFPVEQDAVPELEPAVAGAGGDTALASVQLRGGPVGAQRIGVRAVGAASPLPT